MSNRSQTHYWDFVTKYKIDPPAPPGNWTFASDIGKGVATFGNLGKGLPDDCWIMFLVVGLIIFLQVMIFVWNFKVARAQTKYFHELDAQSTSPNDFAVEVSGLPEDATEEEIAEYFDEYVTQNEETLLSLRRRRKKGIFKIGETFHRFRASFQICEHLSAPKKEANVHETIAIQKKKEDNKFVGLLKKPVDRVEETIPKPDF